MIYGTHFFKRNEAHILKRVGGGGDRPVLIWGLFLVFCFGSQIDVGCGVTMEGTISFPLWYILLHIALPCLSCTYCMPLDFVLYLFDEVF